LASFLATFQFAFALHLSSLTSSQKVASFLDLRADHWDPSLLFLAAGAIPFSITLYRFVTGPALEKYALVQQKKQDDATAATTTAITTPAKSVQTWADWRLWLGSACFGTAWGLGGVCPGPSVINAAMGQSGELHWLGGFVLAGVVAGQLLV
jgi:uncharacterized protein